MGAGRGRRTGMILILLIIVVLLIGVGVVFWLQAQQQPAPTPGEGEGPPTGETVTPSPTPLPPTITIYAASRDILRGTPFDAQNLQDLVTTIEWPDTEDIDLPPGAIIVDEEQGLGPEQLTGRIARVDIYQGQPILDFMLSPIDQPALADVGSDAALKIPSGYVAMAIPINQYSSVAYALREGDHVDLLMSFTFVDVDEEFQTSLPNSSGIVVFPADIDFPWGAPNTTELELGREEKGPLNTKVWIVPGEESQRPRQVTQLVIDDAIVLRVGLWPLVDLVEPIVVTVAAPVATPPPAEGEEVPPGEEAPPEGQPPPPTPTATLEPPTIITLVMTRQDALVLKYAVETGVFIDIVLRSAQDDGRDDFSTFPVTLKYIMDTFNVTDPPKLPIAQEPRIDLIHALIFEQASGAQPGGGGEEVPPGAE